LTSPGERIYRPDFGSPIKGALFEQLTQKDLPTLRRGIISAITKHEQRVSINNVELRLVEDDNTLNVSVDVSPNDNPATSFVIELNLNVGGV
jgi:phage baseplate assembly protein W